MRVKCVMTQAQFWHLVNYMSMLSVSYGTFGPTPVKDMACPICVSTWHM